MAGTLDPHPGALVLLPECDTRSSHPAQLGAQHHCCSSPCQKPSTPINAQRCAEFDRGLEQFLFLTTAALVKLLPAVLGYPVQG